ncbi:family 43 glycosylhydrolase [Parvularcula oceani]|uniref:glycoside hydrolase family 43 protein n=1 Tax=Parvularcula oceani TaxID=1247963 RepID=UPI000A490232|nr:family 43 glycosylhydrolase [Parvularcula oceani]
MKTKTILIALLCSAAPFAASAQDTTESGASTRADVQAAAKQEAEARYDNPLIEQRADPHIVRGEDGTYYFIATVPEYDRLEMRKAESLEGLADAEPIVIWREHETGEMGSHIWAPELHRIDGTWYIYFAAGGAENEWDIRMYALSNPSDDPTTGEWTEEGRIETDRADFSLDATVFEHDGELYYIWAHRLPREYHNTGLKMSRMASPTELTGEEIVLTEPVFDWETRGHYVNEGAAVIKHDGKIFITYSASATDANYAMGLLWADEDADLMDPESWNKSPAPLFFTNEEFDRYGPGHAQFTVNEDGEDVLVYHAREYEEIPGGEPLNDPNRHTRVRVFTWNEAGFPEFGQNRGD